MKRFIGMFAVAAACLAAAGCVSNEVDVQRKRAPELSPAQRDLYRQEAKQLDDDLAKQLKVNSDLEKRRDALRRQVEAKKNAGG